MSPFAEKVRRMDPDRYYAALFAPARIRDRLMVLYAFYLEAAGIPEEVSEPVIGEMRLNWMKEAIDDLFASPAKVRRHDLYEAMAELIKAPGGPAQDDLISMIETRAADLGEGPFPDATERDRYIDQTAGLLMRLAIRICMEGELHEDMSTLSQKAGRVWGFTGLSASFDALTASGRPPLTETEVDRTDLMKITTAAISDLKGLRSICPSELYPALGYVRLARLHLKQDLSAQAINPMRRQLSLLFGSLTGRII